MRLLALAIFVLLAIAPKSDAQTVEIPPQYQTVGSNHNGLAPVFDGQSWSLVDRRGRVRASQIEAIRRGGDNRFGYRVDGRWGIIDSFGFVVRNPVFDDLTPFQSGYAAAKWGDKWALIDGAGWERTPWMFEEISGWEDNYIVGRDAEGWAVFDLDRDETSLRRQEIWFDVEKAYSISDRSVIIQSEGSELLLRLTRFGVRPILQDSASIKRASGGYAAFLDQNGRWGMMHLASESQRWLGQFEGLRSFSQGYAPAKSNGKWGYIDRIGEWAVPPQYDAAYNFHQGYSVVRQGDKRGFLKIDRNGLIRPFIQPQYEDVFRFSDGLAPVKIGGKWGFISDDEEAFVMQESAIVEISP